MIPVDEVRPCPYCRSTLPVDHSCPAGAVGCETNPADGDPCGVCAACIAVMQADPRYGPRSDINDMETPNDHH